MTRPVFLKRKAVWPRILGLLSLCTAFGLGGYWLGHKNASEAMLEDLEAVCSRGAVMQFDSGRVVGCLPLDKLPQLEERMGAGLDKFAKV